MVLKRRSTFSKKEKWGKKGRRRTTIDQKEPYDRDWVHIDNSRTPLVRE